MRIVIAGGGLGGLTCARVLHAHGVEAVVCERDASREARVQGGTLDLTVDEGQWALREAGLEAGYRAIARPEGQDMVLYDSAGTPLRREITPDEGEERWGRPEADRPALRKLLLDALPEETVRWGHAVTGAEPLGDGRHRVHLSGGETLDCDFLIGADGARSRIRPLLADAEPAYCGVHGMELVIHDADRAHPAASALVGRGSFSAIGDQQTLSAQRNGDGTIRVHLTLRCAEDWTETSGIPFDDPDRARAALKELYAGWPAEFLALVDATSGPMLVYPLTALPVGVRWDSTPGVTLIGDAAHLMSPFAGQGANLAMRDGAELALVLAEGGDVAKFEQAMLERAEPAARMSADNLELFLSDGAAEKVRHLFAKMSGEED
ncbi:FAD-dependent oxidoreductase [Amycolatopsis dendrobii]|uniref:Flavin-dependent monooxygenase n=1 Tax=Amycolatopsis dendrobii TaxID=2760662 RepID=A0A7W3VRY9_9PSEU|nr:NAD(P)/FAD-dependent oxidoreductase [Amycolatopsis dendrobii]MBB1152109.1 FAD-dependent monooxygenase [Amycolatopsis dendrobii]